MFTTVFLGCNSLENTKPETNNTNESTSSDLLSLIPPQDDIYGLIQIKSVRPLGKSNYSYSVFGDYFDKAMQDDNKNFMDAGDLTLSTNPIAKRADLAYEDTDQSMIATFFGSNSEAVTLTGNSGSSVPTYFLGLC